MVLFLFFVSFPFILFGLVDSPLAGQTIDSLVKVDDYMVKKKLDINAHRVKRSAVMNIKTNKLAESRRRSSV